MSTVYSVDVEVTVPIFATEVTDRVEDAITNLFPGAEVEQGAGELRGRTHSLQQFGEQLRKQAILDTARTAFIEGRRGDSFSFALKKQAAFEGVVNFAVGNPGELGELHVSVRVADPTVDEFIDRLAPQTEDGAPPEDDSWQ